MSEAPKRRRYVVLALMLAMFLAAMEATAVSTAMPTVIGDLGGINLYSWIFTAYMLTSTVSVPIYGKLADLVGRKPILMVGIGLFLLGSILSGIATSINQLIIFRAIQGLGAGALQTTSLTVIGDLFSLKERARVQGYFAAVWGIAGFSGPLIGGLIVDNASWRWIFFINIPFGLASAIVLMAAYHENLTKKAKLQLDWLGALVLIGASLSLLGVANRIHMPVLLPVSIVLIALFVLIEKRAPEPLLPYDLFRQKIMVVASSASALAGAAMFSVVTYLPLFVQGAERGTPTEAGMALTPMMIGWPLASNLSGRLIPRWGFRVFIVIGLTLLSLAAASLVITIEADWGLVPLYMGTGFFGFGMGLMNTALVIAVQTNVGWAQRGVATGSTMFFRVMGGTLAVGFLGGILAKTLLAYDSTISEDVLNQMLGPHRGQDLAPEVFERLSGGLHDAMVPVFWCVVGFSVLAWILGLWFPKDSKTMPAQ